MRLFPFLPLSLMVYGGLRLDGQFPLDSTRWSSNVCPRFDSLVASACLSQVLGKCALTHLG